MADPEPIVRQRYDVVRSTPGGTIDRWRTEPMTATAEQLASWLRAQHKRDTIEVRPVYPEVEAARRRVDVRYGADPRHWTRRKVR